MTKGDIVVEIANELTIDEIIGSTAICKASNGVSKTIDLDKLVLISGTFTEEVREEVVKAEPSLKKAVESVKAVFKKKK